MGLITASDSWHAVAPGTAAATGVEGKEREKMHRPIERGRICNKGVWMEWRCILLHLIFFIAEEERPSHDAIHPVRTNEPTNTTKYCDDHRRARELS